VCASLAKVWIKHATALVWEKRERYVAFVLFTLLGIAMVLTNALVPSKSAFRSYGPNLAVMFFGVALTLTGVQFFVEREQRRLGLSAATAAFTAARSVWFPLSGVIRVGLLYWGPARGETPSFHGDEAALARRCGALFIGAGMAELDHRALARDDGVKIVTTYMEEAPATYSTYVDLIAEHCPPNLAATLQDLMQGRGWTLLEMVTAGEVDPRSFLGPDTADVVDDFIGAYIEFSTALKRAEPIYGVYGEGRFVAPGRR
jgi:hypothetical protein